MPYVQNRDHLRLFYTDGGPGPAIVFVASAWLDSQMWELETPYLASQGCRLRNADLLTFAGVSRPV